MNTAYNKAVVALIGGLVQFANVFLNTNWVLPEDTVTAIAATATLILVYLIPNKE